MPITHFSRATPAACGEPEPFSVTLFPEDVTCELCASLLQKAYGIRPRPKSKKKQQELKFNNPPL